MIAIIACMIGFFVIPTTISLITNHSDPNYFKPGGSVGVFVADNNQGPPDYIAFNCEILDRAETSTNGQKRNWITIRVSWMEKIRIMLNPGYEIVPVAAYSVEERPE